MWSKEQASAIALRSTEEAAELEVSADWTARCAEYDTTPAREAAAVAEREVAVQ